MKSLHGWHKIMIAVWLLAASVVLGGNAFTPPSPLGGASAAASSGGGGGSGTVNSGTTPQVAYYASNGTAVSGNSQFLLESVGPYTVRNDQNKQTGFFIANATNGVDAASEIRMIGPGTFATSGDYIAAGYGAVLNSQVPFAGRGYLTTGTTTDGMSFVLGDAATDYRWYFGFSPSTTERMRFTSTGLGIGTTNPTEELQIFDTTLARVNVTSNADAQVQIISAGGSASANVLYSSRGSFAVPTATQSGDTLGGLYFGGYQGSFYTARANILSKATETFSGTASGSNLLFNVGLTGATTSLEAMAMNSTEVVVNDTSVNLDFRIEGDTEANLLFVDASTDRVGVGTATPQSRLDVTGSGNGDVAIYNINQTNGTASSSSTYVFSQSTGSGVYGGMSAYGTAGTQTVGGLTPVLLTNNFVISTGSSTNLFTLFHNNNSVTARFDLIKTLPSTSTPARFLSLLGSEISFNDDSYDLDLRVEGDTEANLFFVDASTDRVGVRNGTPLSQLDNDGSFGLAVSTATSSPVAPGGTQFLFRCDASGGNITFNLPAVAGIERRLYAVKKVDATVNTCIIDPSGAETIDGAATRTLTLQNSSVVIQANSTTWSIIASHAAATVL